MAALTAPVKGNIIKSKKFGDEALVLALTKNGKHMKVHVFGRDKDNWHPVVWYDLQTDGLETCWKCGGSGLFYMGGAVVNGVYTGKTGPCFACGGKGKQDNDDRLRNHWYWNRGALEERPRVIPGAPDVPPVDTSPRRPVKQDVSTEAGVSDCKECNTVHRTDVACPW